MFDDVWKDGGGALPIVIDRQGAVAADKGIDHRNIHQACCRDDFLEMADDHVTVGCIGVEWIGVITKCRNEDILFSQDSLYLINFIISFFQY